MISPDERSLERAGMVREQILRRGITDSRVLEAFRRVPRESFIPESLRSRAFEGRPLEIGEGQTISQPYMAALMTLLLGVEEGMRVLEIGTGSGYQAAILCEMGARVWTVERLGLLKERAEAALRDNGYGPEMKEGDGSQGWAEEAPFDRIVLTAGAPEVPESLLGQLVPGGRLLAPVGGRDLQELVEIRRTKGGLERRRHGKCLFVPLIGSEGW